MHFNEHLDRVKKYYTQKEIRVPFLDANSILKKIESRFVFQKRVIDELNVLSQYHNYWFSTLKNKTVIAEFPYGSIYNWIEKLGIDTHYWMVIAFSESQKHHVFDCTPKTISPMFSISRCSFYIVDKKYKWLVYFLLDNEKQQFTLYKSGNALTDFEIMKETSME